MKSTFNKFSLIWQEAITGIEHILPATWTASDHGAKHDKHVAPHPHYHQKIKRLSSIIHAYLSKRVELCFVKADGNAWLFGEGRWLARASCLTLDIEMLYQAGTEAYRLVFVKGTASFALPIPLRRRQRDRKQPS